MNKIYSKDDVKLNELFKRFGWKMKSFESETCFLMESIDGSTLKNCPLTLKLIIQDFYERADEEDLSEPKAPKTVYELFEEAGFEVYCESPLEVGNKELDIFLSGEAAIILKYHLRNA